MEQTLVLTPTLPKVDTELMSKIEAIDLTNTRNRLIVKKGFDPEVVEQAIADYRNYLYIVIVFEGTHEPTQMVDEVWHDHILHTKKYMEDCMAIAGRYIHHQPYDVQWDPELGCAECSGTTNCQEEKAKTCDADDTKCVPDIQVKTCYTFDSPVADSRPRGNYRELVGALFTVPAGLVAEASCGDVLCGTCNGSNCS